MRYALNENQNERMPLASIGVRFMATGVLTPSETAAPEQKQPQDWRILLALFLLAGIVESQAFGHLGAFTPLFLQELRVPADQISTWTGIMQSLGFVIGLPLLPFWGVWADRYSRKLIIVRSAYVEGVLFTLAAFSPNVYFLAVARLLTGFVFGNTGVMLALLADTTPRQRLGLAVGIASAGFPIGSSVGPLLGGLVAQHFGIRTLLGLDGVLSALTGITLTLAVREIHHRGNVGRSAWQVLRAAAHDILATPAVVRLFALYFLAMYGLSLTTPFIPILLQRLDRGNPVLLPSVIGATLTAAGVAMAVTTPLWGKAGDAFGRWRILPLCLAAVAVAICGEGLAGALLPLQAAIVGVGLFQGGITTTLIALLALLAPEARRASILNFSLLPSQLSWFLGPLTGAGLAALSLRLPFFACAALLAVATVMALALLRRTASMTDEGAEAPA
jgi:DHA1 family multidrug resistance protein-like MFS transporter